MTKLIGEASIIEMGSQSPVVAQLYEEKESNHFRTYKMVYNEKEIGNVRFKHIKISNSDTRKLESA